MPRKNNEKMVIISVHVPPAWVEAMDRLVAAGYAANRSELIRMAIMELLAKTGVLKNKIEPIQIDTTTNQREVSLDDLSSDDFILDAR